MAHERHDKDELSELPPELFFGIAEALASLGLRRTLLHLMLACRGCYAVGLPALMSDVVVGSGRDSIGPKSLSGGLPLDSDKLGLVRRIFVRGRYGPVVGLRKFLVSCIRTCESLDCDLVGRDLAGALTDVAMNQSAGSVHYKLRELSIAKSTGHVAFQIPPSLTKIALTGDQLGYNSPFYGTPLREVLARLRPQRELDLDLDLGAHDLSPTTPDLLRRIKVCRVSNAWLGAFVARVLFFSPYVLHVSFRNNTSKGTMLSFGERLVHFPSVRVLVMNGVDMRTSMLLSFSPPDWIRAIVLETPRQDLPPADFSRIKKDWGSHGLELRMRTADWDAEAAGPERDFWRSLRGKVRVTLVDGFRGMS
ncbi:hypothetical protein DFJ74DRAFT_715421 [Hyaloraphidium curvatum]|nr:hypothetical protein DFJ74DRAFT_715421 [Hyaloraphidium curvatum]